MENLALIASPIAVVLVFIVLCLGLWNMTRGHNPNLSQKLMRLRVVMQFVAICILMTAVYYAA